MARARKLPDVDEPVTVAELDRLVERLGHDPKRVSGFTLTKSVGGFRANVRYVSTPIYADRDD